MVNLEYRNAYSEVLEILKYISEEDFCKIPNDLIRLFKENSNKDYIFYYNPNRTLQEQNVSKTAKYIIAILFRDYWSTPKQKEKILAKEKLDFNKIEEEKRNLYNPNNIFQNNSNEIVVEELALVEYENQSLWYKIKKILGIV